MLEAAKRLIQLGRREEEGGHHQEKREKRRSLVELVMSPSRIFNGEQLVEREEEVGEDEERHESAEDEVGGVRKFTSNTGGGRRRRRSSLVGRAGKRKSGGSHRSCPDLAALARVDGSEMGEEESTMSLQRGEEKGRQSWLSKLRGRKEGVEEEEMVDTVDTNTANVFGGANIKTQLIDINFE